MNRRDFVCRLFASLSLFVIVRRASAQDAKKDAATAVKPAAPVGKPAAGAPKEELKMVKESDPMAKSLNYCENADQKKDTVCPVRKEPARAKQYCDNCQFYTAAGTEAGKCQILQNNGVKAKGWCNSWVQKAGA